MITAKDNEPSSSNAPQVKGEEKGDELIKIIIMMILH